MMIPEEESPLAGEADEDGDGGFLPLLQPSRSGSSTHKVRLGVVSVPGRCENLQCGWQSRVSQGGVGVTP